MALTLARPEGNASGGSGLAMFYVETRTPDGRLNGIRVERLKDKLGTRKVPTAELMLEGARAELVGETRNGTRAIEPMLVVTRTWNSVTSVAFMRRAVALAKAYARERRAFGSKLSELPLHIDTLADLEAQTRAAFLLAFELVELLGRQETGELEDDQASLLRLLTPISKLLTAKQAVAVVSEAIEAFGGAGYVEDTGLPTILRDTQVLPIWEGTTNVLSLDLLRALGKGGGLEALHAEVERNLAAATDAGLAQPCDAARAAMRHAIAWAQGAMSHPDQLEAGARRLAMTLGRSLELALLVGHAQWCLDHGFGARAAAAARRFAQAGVDQLTDAAIDDTRLLSTR
jgi:hypothetical protein